MTSKDKRPIIIGTRGSDLALWQANYIKRALEATYSGRIDIKIIKTKGDKIDDVAFNKMEGKGFFTREIEDALLAREIDIAVHSLKDLMTTQPQGLRVGAVGYRADRRDVLLIRNDAYEQGGVIPVREGAVTGSGSARRQCQIAYFNSTLKISDLRGNVPTRVNKLRDGQYDAIVIAAAGINRLKLDLSGLKAIYLDAELFLPAPGQGLLAVQLRDDDPEVEYAITGLGSEQARLEAELERGLLARFDSGCSLPLGVYSQIKRNAFRLSAVLGRMRDGVWDTPLRVEVTGNDINEVVDRCYRGLAANSRP